MISLIAVVNGILAALFIGIIITIMNVNSKFEWAFGDDAKRERLSYKFMRLLVVAILLGVIAVAANILFLL